MGVRPPPRRRAESLWALGRCYRRVDEPDVFLTELAAAPAVVGLDEGVVVVPAAVAEVVEAGKLHRVVELGADLRSVTSDVGFDVGDLVHGPRHERQELAEPVDDFVDAPADAEGG